MPARLRRGGIRLKPLLILLVTGTALIGGLAGAYYWRRAFQLQEALEEGNRAWQAQEWRMANRYYGRYLARRPEDGKILRRYATAQLNVQPLEITNIQAAVSAHRRLIQLHEADAETYRTLALLYQATGNGVELKYIADQYADVAPDDARADIWCAQAEMLLRRPDAARALLSGVFDRLAESAPRSAELEEAGVLLAALEVRDTEVVDRAAALGWLNRTLECNPSSSLALVHRAALKIAAAADAAANERAALLTAARGDLTAAESTDPRRPTVRLMLVEQWLALDAFDHVRQLLVGMDDATPVELRETFIDPLDWEVARFQQAVNLALRTDRLEPAMARAPELLEACSQRRHQLQLLPSVVELYVAADMVDKAAHCVSAYRSELMVGDARPGQLATAAYLQALLARARGDYYAVIALLEPQVRRESAGMLRKLLAEAYNRTNQPQRAAALLREVATPELGSEAAAENAVRTYLRAGAFAEALRVAEQALARYPDNPILRTQRLQGRFGLATQMAANEFEREIEALTAETVTLIADAPRHIEPRLLLAALQMNRGAPDEAVRVLEQAAREFPEQPDALLRLCELHARRGDWGAAEAAAERVTQSFGDRAAVWLMVADVLVAQERYDAARQRLDEALQQLDGAEAYRDVAVRRASLDILHGDRETGIERLLALADERPQDVTLRALLLRLPEVRDQAALAARLIEEMRKTEGETGVFWRLHEARRMFAADTWRDDRERIERHLRRCLEANPAWTEPTLLLADMYARLGDSAQEERVLRSALRSAADPLIVDRLMWLLRRQQRFADARALLTQLKPQLDAQAAARSQIALALEAGDYDTAIRDLQEQITRQQHAQGDLLLLARLTYAQTRDAERALRILERAADAGEDPLSVAGVRAFILVDTGKTDAARGVLDALVAADDRMETRLLRGSFMVEIGDEAAARADFAALPELSDDGDGHALYGGYLAQRDELNAAIDVWSAGLAAHPDNEELQRRLARGLVERGGAANLSRAVELVARLRTAHPRDAEILWTAAALAMRGGKTADEVRPILEAAVDAAPSRLNTYLGLIRIARDLQLNAVARQLFLRAETLFGNDARLLTVRGEFDAADGDIAAGIRAGRAALAADRTYAPAYLLLIRLAQRGDDRVLLSDLHARLTEALRANPDEPELSRAYALLLEATDGPQPAIEYLRQRVAAGGGTVALYLTLAGLNLTAEQTNAAAAALEQAERAGAQGPVLLDLRLQLLQQRGELAALQEKAVQAVDNDPAAYASVVASAADRLRLTRDPRAVAVSAELYDAALTADPELVPAYLGRAILAIRAGATEQAINLYRSALLKNPDQPEALNNLAWLLMEEQARPADALPYARRAVELQPENANYRDTLGRVLSRLPGRLDEARTELQTAVQLTRSDSPERAKALLALARVCHLMNNHEMTRQLLDEARSLEQRLEESVFSDEEQLEIGRLLTAAENL